MMNLMPLSNTEKYSPKKLVARDDEGDGGESSSAPPALVPGQLNSLVGDAGARGSPGGSASVYVTSAIFFVLFCFVFFVFFL
jgi:hypothetical protein